MKHALCPALVLLLVVNCVQAVEVPFVELKGHTSTVHSAIFSPDGKMVVTASEDGTAKIWDAESGEELQTLAVQAVRVYSAAFSPDGKEVVTSSFMGSGNDNTVQVWDAKTGEALRRLEGETAAIDSAFFSPDGKRILTGGMRNTARIWDAELGKEVQALPGHAQWVRAIAWSADGTKIVTVGNEIRIWDAKTGEALHTLLKGAYAVAFSPDSMKIATGGGDYCTRIWDVESGRELKALYVGQSRDAYTPATVKFIAYSPDGTKIVTTNDVMANLDKTIRIWDTESGRELGTLDENPRRSRSAVFSPDGKKIVVASADGNARIWDLSAMLKQWADADKRYETQHKEGYLDLNKEQLKYGFLRLNDLNNLNDFVQFGNADLKEKLNTAQENLRSADGSGKTDAQEKIDAIRPEIAAAQAEIAQKTFYAEYAYLPVRVRTDGDKGSFTMGVQTRIIATKIDEILFPMPDVTGSRVHGVDMAISVNGSADSIQELASNSSKYRVGVWFTNLRHGPLMFGGAAEVLKIEIIKVE